jgi:hypothetical protein
MLAAALEIGVGISPVFSGSKFNGEPPVTVSGVNIPLAYREDKSSSVSGGGAAVGWLLELIFTPRGEHQAASLAIQPDAMITLSTGGV